MTTTLNGTFTSCGPGQDFGYQFVCNGPSCDELADFPGTTCTSDPTTNALSCNNGVTCSGPSNYTASFNLSQATSLVSLSELITLPDLCEDITVTSSGTTGGVNASYIVTGPCGPGGNTTATNSSSSSSSLLPSTSTQLSNSSLSTSSTGLSSFSFFNTSSSVIPTTSVGSAGLGGTTGYPSSSSSSGGSSPATSSTPGYVPSTVPCSEPSSAAVSPIVSVTTEVVTAYTTYCPEATTFTQGSSTYTVTAPTTLTITNCPCTLTHTLTGSTPVLAASATTSAASPSNGGNPGGSGASGGNGSGSNAPGSYTSANASGSSGSGSNTPGSEGSNTSAENASSPAAPGASTATNTGSYAGTVTSSASAQPITVLQSSGANSMRSGFKLSPSKLITIFLSLFFIGSTLASSVNLDSDTNLNHVDNNIALRENISPAGWISSGEISTTNVDLIKRQSTPGWKAFAGLLGEYLGGKLASPGFAENLVAELEEAVCDHIVGGLITDALGVDLVEACVGAIDLAGGLAALGTLQPEVEFLAVLESNILCNALVAEALPGIGQLTDAICKEPKPCSQNLLTDVNNCGQCNNTCSTGESCVNGACTSGSCTGETCASFGPCGPGGTCVCASTAEGTGYCVDGSTPCAGLANCDTSLDCASGEICAVGSCCDVNVCVGATFCGGSNGGDLTARGLLRRTWFNSTISSHGDWYPEFF